MVRCWRTLLNADVVGYTLHMAAHERATTRAIILYMTHLSEQVARHGGRVLDTTGDNLLAEFEDEGSAVRCGQRLQDDQEPLYVAGQRLLLRLGIHSGQVFKLNGRCYGHAVNVAARLQQAADPGTVMVSGVTMDRLPGQVQPRSSLWEMRRMQLKHLPSPIVAYQGRVR